jgi:hypothetical protein
MILAIKMINIATYFIEVDFLAHFPNIIIPE